MSDGMVLMNEPKLESNPALIRKINFLGTSSGKLFSHDVRASVSCPFVLITYIFVVPMQLFLALVDAMSPVWLLPFLLVRA